VELRGGGTVLELAPMHPSFTPSRTSATAPIPSVLPQTTEKKASRQVLELQDPGTGARLPMIQAGRLLRHRRARLNRAEAGLSGPDIQTPFMVMGRAFARCAGNVGIRPKERARPCPAMDARCESFLPAGRKSQYCQAPERIRNRRASAQPSQRSNARAAEAGGGEIGNMGREAFSIIAHLRPQRACD